MPWFKIAPAVSAPLAHLIIVFCVPGESFQPVSILSLVSGRCWLLHPGVCPPKIGQHTPVLPPHLPIELKFSIATK